MGWGSATPMRARRRAMPSSVIAPSFTGGSRRVRGVRRPLGTVVAVEAQLAAPQFADGEEVALVALAVVRTELDVGRRPAVRRRHPPDAFHPLLHPPRFGDGGVADAVDGNAGGVVGERDDDVAGGAPEALLEATDHRVVVRVGAVLAELVDAVPALQALGPLVGVRIEHERRA